MRTLLIYCIAECILFGTVSLLGPTVQSESLNGGSKHECNQTITTQFGTIYSPGYPDRYPRYSRCVYVVEKSSPDVCEIKLTMEKFDVAKMAFSNCSEDFFEVMNRDKTYRLCGELPGGSKRFVYYPENSSKLIFRFQSTFHQNKGFSIQIKQLQFSCPRSPVANAAALRAPVAAMPATPACSQEISSRIGRITFPEDAGNEVSKCTYTIHRSEPRACVVQLDLSSFEVAYSAGCTQDHLLLPTRQKLCGVLGGSRKILQFPPGEDVLTLEFFNSGHNSNSFDIQIAQLPGPCLHSSTPVPTGITDVDVELKETTTDESLTDKFETAAVK